MHMKTFEAKDLNNLFKPKASSHKGQNGKLLIIGGCKLFHSASLWSLSIASRIVDMVFYSSIDENNKIVEKLKEEFRNGIVVPRNRVEDYIEEADCILIGPGLPRKEGCEEGDQDTKELTEGLLKKYPHKKWVIDGGSLQVINPDFIPSRSILTPHQGEFVLLFNKEATQSNALEMARKYRCTILLKGEKDIICSGNESITIEGGNAGMTKGGTGDVLAGLVASFYCKNDGFFSALAASFINKKAADDLYQKVGFYFNASDLADQIPLTISLLTKN